MLTGDQEAAARAVAADLFDRRVSFRALARGKGRVDRAASVQRGAGGDGGRRHQRRPVAGGRRRGRRAGGDRQRRNYRVGRGGVAGRRLGKLAEAVACGQRVLRTIRQNIVAFAVLFNLASVAAASSGWISPVTAAVVHQVSSLAVVLNSLRLLVDARAWRRRIGDWGRGVRRRRWSITAAGAAAALVAYLAGGLHTIGIGELGAVQRFGKRVVPFEQPGLHYRLPYPFAWHYVIRPAEAHRVEIGFRSVPGEPAEPPAYEWNVQHRGGRYLPVPAESYAWSGDENLIDVNLVVHYRVADPAAALFRVGVADPVAASSGPGLAAEGPAGRWDSLVRAECESAFRAEIAQREADDLLGGGRQEIAAAVSAGRTRPWTAAAPAWRSSRCASATSTRRWKWCPPSATFPSPWRKRRPGSTRPRPTSTGPRPPPAGRRPSGRPPRPRLPPRGRNGPRPPPCGSWKSPRPMPPRPTSPACGFTWKPWKRRWRANAK